MTADAKPMRSPWELMNAVDQLQATNLDLLVALGCLVSLTADMQLACLDRHDFSGDDRMTAALATYRKAIGSAA